MQIKHLSSERTVDAHFSRTALPHVAKNHQIGHVVGSHILGKNGEPSFPEPLLLPSALLHPLHLPCFTLALKVVSPATCLLCLRENYLSFTASQPRLQATELRGLPFFQLRSLEFGFCCLMLFCGQCHHIFSCSNGYYKAKGCCNGWQALLFPRAFA